MLPLKDLKTIQFSLRFDDNLILSRSLFIKCMFLNCVLGFQNRISGPPKNRISGPPNNSEASILQTSKFLFFLLLSRSLSIFFLFKNPLLSLFFVLFSRFIAYTTFSFQNPGRESMFLDQCEGWI